VSRLERLRERVEAPLLVSAAANVRYLTGLASSNAYLLVERERVRLFTDFRYIERARGIDGVEAVEVARDVVGELPSLVSGRLAFEADDLTYGAWQRLRDGGLELEPTHGLVEALRAVKDEREVAAIRRACEASDGAFAALAHERFTGRSERELAWRMEELLHEHGGQGLSFDTLVAAGPSGASPHSELSDDPIAEGTLVIVDAGCTVDGYCSDCTRTFATGALPEELARAYDTCLEAQLAALAGIRPGMTGREADAIARERIDAAGYGGRFGHGLGHGLGLLVHEAPAVRPESDDVLEPGNVFSVEPGIYLPGVAGVRIEDLVVVREDGAERLTTVPKELVTVD
jgi:Xaa-Pro aminopeptidase